MNLKKKIFSSLAAGAMLLNLATPAFAGITLEISGNGSDSDNEVELEQSNEVEVTQTNVANVLNDVQVEANTGKNDAEDNTGGDVEIETGDAEVNVSVSNTLNSNTAEVDACCEGDVDAKITGNGTDSDNEIELELENEVEIAQANQADVWNYVDTDAKTGRNDADDNTGGEVSVKTGDAKSTVAVSTAANSNSAWVMGGGEGGSLSAVISDNGSDSDNEIEIEVGGGGKHHGHKGGSDNGVELMQANLANVLNDVEVDAKTGKNDAEDNTGGEVSIETGDATADVTVDNMVNFNWADIDGCGCLEDVLAKISGNGTDSDNEIEVELENEQEVGQANDFDCKFTDKDACASVDVELKTGKNDADDNTLGGDDPAIETGDADASVEVSNSGNSNVYGEAPGWEWEMPWGFDFNFNFSFDLEDLLGFLS